MNPEARKAKLVSNSLSVAAELLEWWITRAERRARQDNSAVLYDHTFFVPTLRCLREAAAVIEEYIQDVESGPTARSAPAQGPNLMNLLEELSLDGRDAGPASSSDRFDARRDGPLSFLEEDDGGR